MIIIYVLLAALIVGVVWRINIDHWDTFGPDIVMVLSGLFLAIAIAGIPLNKLGVRANIERFYAIADTAEYARSSGDALEGAAFRLKIAEANQWLAEAKYWRGTTFWIYWPDEIDDMEPIK